MNEEVSITLTENDCGQIIDGLTCRAEQYELTAKYHDDASVDEAIIDVRDAAETRELAQRYQGLVEQIGHQLHNQRRVKNSS